MPCSILEWCDRKPEEPFPYGTHPYIEGRSEAYPYENLAEDEIRTLIVQPGRPEDPLHATIERHKLKDNKHYTALSYVWGSSKREQTLFVGKYTIAITRSADVVLRRLRDEKEPKRVWIDAICINQDNMEEKGQQVKLMGSIFSDADGVAIWLGESDEYTKGLFRAFHKWVKTKHPQAWWNPYAKYLERLSDFVERDWFQRAWTFQEACLSDKAELLCGTYRLPWNVFVMAVISLSNCGLISQFGDSSDTVTALSLFSVANPNRKEAALSVVLPFTRRLQSQEPSDKVFSMLGMAKQGLRGITPDYSIGFEEVYTRCARAMIRQEGGLSVFCGTHGPEIAKEDGLPSWAPNWTRSRRVAYIHGFDWPRVEDFVYHINKGATFDTKVNAGGCDADEPSSPHLSLRGAIIDHVDRVRTAKIINTTRMQGYKMQRPEQMIEQMIEQLCVELDIGRGGYEARHKAKAQLMYTLTANKASNKTVQKVTGYCDPDREVDEEGEKGFLSNPSSSEEREKRAERRERLAQAIIYTFLQGRAVFRTRAGLIGIGPDYMKEGDQVWDVLGGEVPFILRAAARDENDGRTKLLYNLVGECYVHGIMNGELWQPSTPKLPAAVTGEKLVFEDIELV